MASLRTPDGLTIEPPEGFELEESMLALRKSSDALNEPRARQPQQVVRPNLLIRRRPARTGATLEQLAGEMCGELVKSLPGLDDLETAVFKFTDGHEGLMVAYDFAATEATLLRQYHALRLDEGTLTTLTLTCDARALSEELRDRWFASLASAGPAPAESTPIPGGER